MESVVWMLQQASIPIAVGFAMALTLCRLSRWRPQAKVRAGLIYEILILAGLFAGTMHPHARLENIGLQLRQGVWAAFGIGIAMGLMRLSATWKGRVAGGLFLALYVAALCSAFEREFRDVIARFHRI